MPVTASPQNFPFIIVGGGLAAAKAAEAIRQARPDDAILLIARETVRPYHRPPLSKDFLRGETPRDGVFVHPSEWAKEHHVDMRLGVTARRVNVSEKTVELDDGSTLLFGRLLLATGSQPRKLDVPGANLDNVLLLRTLQDSERIKTAAAGKKSAVSIGGGFIGAETAASLRQLGLDTSVVTTEAILWNRVFGPRVAPVFQRVLESHGVKVHNQRKVVRMEGRDRVEAIVTDDGTKIACDLVVVGVGAAPETSLAQEAGLAVDNGVQVDSMLESSEPGIYAAGDIANFQSPLYGKRLRVEHWDIAQTHGEIAGKNMASDAAGKRGDRQQVDQPPYFYSDLFDLSMEYLGSHDPNDDVIARGNLSGSEFTAFYVHDGILVAAVFINRNADVESTRTLIGKKLRVNEAVRNHLADTTRKLEDLAS